MTERLDPVKAHTSQQTAKGVGRILMVTASVPRARDIARRILRGWQFDEVRYPDTETTAFIVTRKVKQ